MGFHIYIFHNTKLKFTLFVSKKIYCYTKVYLWYLVLPNVAFSHVIHAQHLLRESSSNDEDAFGLYMLFHILYLKNKLKEHMCKSAKPSQFLCHETGKNFF